MKVLWRISIYASLSGEGGKIASARWHTRGSPIVYLAETPAGAMVEYLVHFAANGGQLPPTYDLLQVQAPDEIAIKELLPLADVEWKENPLLTRRIGDEWLAGKETPLARVPSAIVPWTWNILLNPNHPDAGSVQIETVNRERFDTRLFRLSAR
jgi:RES domain-containing protein